MPEFTGERVIPGEVEVDLWNEHVSRYAFAARMAAGRRVLEMGCGTGYGAARLAADAASVTATDIAAEAVEYAQSHHALENLSFLCAPCTRIPAPDGSFDLVIAFEVIEHVPEWRAALAEARRLLAPGGLFVVSTPNRDYYEASRGKSGPNPYHVHEFDFEEFSRELACVFPAVTMVLQNHSGAFVFEPAPGPQGTPRVQVECGAGKPDEANFFLAVCSLGEPVTPETFVYVPRAANVLRERELHIERLEGELATKDEWLAEAKAEKQKVVEMFREQTAEMEGRNRWAEDLDAQLRAARERIAALQEELAAQYAGYEAKVAELEEDVRRRTEWAVETERRLGGELERKCNELAECVRLLDKAEATVEERTRWAQGLHERLQTAEAKIAMASASRWLRAGRALGIGPDLRKQ